MERVGIILTNMNDLEELFWETVEKGVGAETITEKLREKIQIARLIGIALRHGFAWAEDGS